jgi:hypothetical protein
MLPICNSLRLPSIRYLPRMSFPPEKWRRERLAELAKTKGGRAALGRLLGLTSGAFIRQMIDGERPITEKTIKALQGLEGCAGWFDSPIRTPPPSPATSEDPFGALTDEERRFLADFRILLDNDRERCRQHVAEKAQQMRDYLAKLGLPFNTNHTEH